MNPDYGLVALQRGFMPRFSFMIHKIAFGIEYDGSRYSGWQRQQHTPETVQEYLEEAISSVADESITLYCAGRTDSGVHASGQVAHIETSALRSQKSWIRGVNTKLPGDIAVQWAQKVSEDFHARYKACRRSYRYIIDNTQTYRGALNRFRTSWVYKRLDENKMIEASKCLLGTHDFSSFQALTCQAKSPVKTISRLDIYRKQWLIVIEIEADAFLHHMVRNIAGALIAVGSGEQDVSWCRSILQARDRTRGGVTARPEGLFLTGVRYPHKYGIPLSENRPVIT